MNQIVTKRWISLLLLALLAAAAPSDATINKSVKIEAGSQSDGASSVNGSITVGAGAVVSGNVKTVNGAIRVADNAAIAEASTVNGSLRMAAGVQSQDLSTVNGSIKVGENATVTGEVSAVNGRIGIDNGSRVTGDVGNVNGDINLAGSEVGGDLTTVSGDVNLSEGAVLKGDLVVEKPSVWSWGKQRSRTPEIIIGPGSRVEGTIRLEREVKLYISENAEVGGVEGEMTMSDAVRFSGERP